MMYFGEVLAPNAGGPIVVTLPKSAEGFVSGSIKIGARPNQALSGFTGRMTGPTTFEAVGENRRGRGMDTVHLAIEVKGETTEDGQHVRGTVLALINGVPQQPWSFTAGVRGADPLESPQGERGELAVEWSEDEGLLATLTDIPAPIKWVAGAGAAIAAAFYAKKRFIDK